MKKFINRNAPVFIIGGITLVIFLIIIGLSQSNNQTETELIRANASDLIAPHTYIKGPQDASVTIVEFSDFGCPACKEWQPVIDSVMSQFPNDVRVAFRHFPLPQHKNADNAARAAQAAGEEGKFWQYARLLFDNQGKFNDEQLISYAEQLGMDKVKFENSYRNGGFEALVKEDMQYGNQLGVQATPTIFLNGEQVKVGSFDEFVKLVETEVNKANGDNKPAVEPTTDTGIFPNSSTGEPVSTEAALMYEKADKLWGVLEINYREAGFDPKSAQVFAGQLVRWINTTDREIELQQLVLKFDEFKEPVKIAPQGKFEFRISDKNIWSYQEGTTKSFGSIFIKPQPAGI